MNDCYNIDSLDKMVKHTAGGDEVYLTKQQLQESHSSSSCSSSICSSSIGLSPTTSQFQHNPILSDTTTEQQQGLSTISSSSNTIIDPDLAQHIEYELGLTKKNGNSSGGGGGTRKNAWGNLSYAELITKAISNSQGQRLTLSEIYDWMIKYVPFFRNKVDRNSSAGWKNSIRHNLSLHNRFKRVQSEGTGKSSWWMINPDEKNPNSNLTLTKKQTRRRLQQQHSLPVTSDSNNKTSHTTIQSRRTRHTSRTSKLLNDNNLNSVNMSTCIEQSSSAYDNSNTITSLPLPSLQNDGRHLLVDIYDTSDYDNQQWSQPQTDLVDAANLYDHSNTDLYHTYSTFDDSGRYHNESHYQQQQQSPYDQPPFCPSMYHSDYHQHHQQRHSAYYQQEQTSLTASADTFPSSYSLQQPQEASDDQHINYFSRAYSSSSHSSSSLSPPQLNNALNTTVYPTTATTSSSSSCTNGLSRNSSVNSSIQPPPIQHYENYSINHTHHKPDCRHSNTNGGGPIFNGHRHYHDIETLLHLNSVDDDDLSSPTVTINERFYTGGQQQQLQQHQPNPILRTVLKRAHPFLGTESISSFNAAFYAKNITNTCETLIEWCEKGDTMIVDRGFRDVIDSFVEMDYEPKMPEFLTKGQKQHTVEQANRSRLITKVRWSVESSHARMKKWILLGGRVENAFIPKLADCVRIVSAALNCYRGPIGQNTINSDDSTLAQYMCQQIGCCNILLLYSITLL
ncbi:unnamed protein product [Didymodactylos carnosus]|uniref:Fork-head domain-containing protein n=1 Tax=Didymodactylos carnosus TaxID=1234261 RepID=A0A813W0F0_9BILA|nr:unnamed protein product [Didymodactylos carnosus]CAF0919066.1 unnamed protein product [Didymodactylos carnosus]CAF3632841.1 unnamed protein product [Didymodactylos carnosus]CAF3696831.1 unnamed protein product [Didymodactylos carnosus]